MRNQIQPPTRSPPITALADPAALADPGPPADAVPELLARLRGSLRGSVEADAGTRALYSSDASNYRVLPAAVVAPRDRDDLAEVVARAAEAGVPLTMRGAGTSVAGNAIGTGLVVDLSRHLTGVLALDPEARTVTVLPGTVLDDLNRAAAAHGLRLGPDPSTHSRCTVGGNARQQRLRVALGPVGDHGREHPGVGARHRGRVPAADGGTRPGTRRAPGHGGRDAR